jgi:hypothetical protein
MSMKVQIEVTEDELREAFTKRVKDCIDDKVRDWRTESYIKEQIESRYKGIINAMIVEALENSEGIKSRIQEGIEHKLRAQLTALMKVKK